MAAQINGVQPFLRKQGGGISGLGPAGLGIVQFFWIRAFRVWGFQFRGFGVLDLGEPSGWVES